MSDSSKDGILALTGVLLALTIITVALRFEVRRRRKTPIKADDWFVLLGLFSFIGACITVFVMVRNKVLGYSTHDFTPKELAAIGRTNNESQVALDILTNNTLAFSKLSALFFYRRIFCEFDKRSPFGWATGITAGLVVAWLLVFQFLAGFQCGTHFSALWDGGYRRYCTISFPFLYGLVISDFLLDVWILGLPIPSILGLHTTLQKKLSIIAVFLVALVGLGASIARMAQYIKIELGGPDYLLNTDHERLVTQSFFYTMLESGVAVIAVNLPSLRVFHNISSLSLSLSSLKTGGGSLLRSLLLRSRSNIGRDEDDDEDNDAWTTTPKPPGSSSTSSTRPSQQSSSHSDHYYYMHGLPPPMAVRDFPFQEDLLQRPARVVSRGEQV